jgi:hypothetical protein
MYARFAGGLVSFLRHQTTVDEARETIRRRLETRHQNFLRILERGVFGYPSSPYLPLFKEAGCEQGDVIQLIRSVGLEETLQTLRKAGVYVDFEEFKGRKPIRRGLLTLQVSSEDFDNPYLRHRYETSTSGSSGPKTRTWLDLDHLAATTCYTLMGLEVHGLRGIPTALWRPILPACTGVSNLLRSARVGNVARKWFSPLRPGDLRPSLKYAVSTRYILLTGRLVGVPLPGPEPVRIRDAVEVARWARDAVLEFGACLVRSYVSLALRIALAALEHGIDLRGVVLTGGGEPPTPAKVRQITESGARWIPTYAFSEFGQVAGGCAHPQSGNDLHLFHDAIALTPVPQDLPGWDAKVDVFHFTTLLPSSPKIMLNVGLDDYGVVDQRSCGCGFEALGFATHLEGIRSFSKLTGEGMSVAGSEMQEILESLLPETFGGSAFDYQLEEKEDGRGFTRLDLLVSPEIALPADGGQQVLQTILSGLQSRSPAAELARAIWKEANSLRIRRERPICSSNGKYFCIRKSSSAP